MVARSCDSDCLCFQHRVSDFPDRMVHDHFVGDGGVGGRSVQYIPGMSDRSDQSQSSSIGGQSKRRRCKCSSDFRIGSSRSRGNRIHPILVGNDADKTVVRSSHPGVVLVCAEGQEPDSGRNLIVFHQASLRPPRLFASSNAPQPQTGCCRFNTGGAGEFRAVRLSFAPEFLVYHFTRAGCFRCEVRVLRPVYCLS